MKIYRIAQRKYGRTLPETGYEYKFVNIFRAVAHTVSTIGNMDYITLSKKFANEHAEHMAVTTEEDQVVLAAMVLSKDVAEASNPGEYFYIGTTPINGKITYEAKFENI